MKIQYLNGSRLLRGLQIGGMAIIRNQKHLNEINVFPVADADTGFNLAMTMQAIMQRSKIGHTLKETLDSVADSALTGARGNSGIIFAQYLHGLSRELPEIGVLTATHFAQSAQRAVKHLYDSLINPVEGTILTVIREWADHLVEQSQKTSDFLHLLTSSLAAARKSLHETTTKLKVLTELGVVDAGARGFVYFLEGVVDFINHGSLRELKLQAPDVVDQSQIEIHTDAPNKYRFCTEAILSDVCTSMETLKRSLSSYGDSLILAGSVEKLHLHIHTNNPDALFEELFSLGQVSAAKVDDMLRQYQIANQRKYPIGLITDTACDLPQSILDEHQIVQIPFGLSFGKRFYLDKQTILPERFYNMLKTCKDHPVSSQPSPASVESIMTFALANYEQILNVHISDKLSGVLNTVSTFAAKQDPGRAGVINSRHLSVSEGLLVLRIARAIESGCSFDAILHDADTWIANTKIYTDVNTLRYMVRGGRVKPLTGLIAALLNLKPIVSLDSEGKAIAWGKSFSRSRNMSKIARIIKQEIATKRVWEYAIVHADARERAITYSNLLSEIIGKEPAYIMPLAPVVGVHNGNGAVGIGVSYD
ncbi:MAG: DegV family protein [Candidatus Cloacimonetes bacterium]|nr:DegV family EDD domain-containing protein [Candidatus Cloacimonadota bacterium]MDD2683516.1 DegV family protein [Candidatus Cloacimonadota bacterium]MDD4035541.1 DegV family protein [Candidatus Cloacimonadota bacterium]